jgi:hypothetical protein
MSKVIYVIQVEKKEIIEQNIDRVIFEIIKIEGISNNICQKVMIIIDGYNDVVDELYTILEVRSWVNKLFGKMPQLFYYLNQEFEAHIYMVCCLADQLESGYVGDYRPIQEYTDFKTIPRINALVSVSNITIKRMIKGILDHGKRMKKNNQARETAESIDKLFNKGDLKWN